MSAFMHPNGPEPAAVYWVRRAAILVVLLTVVVGVWWLFGAILGGGSSSDVAATSAEAGSAAAGDPDAAAGALPAADEGSAEPAEPTPCPDSVIAVEATTDSSTYPVGSKPRLTLSITNTSQVACTRDVGPKANELEITSGGYHVWSSDDCNASKKSNMTTLEPGQTVASSITWNGRLTQKGCPDGKGAKAKAGRYDVQGRNGKVKSDLTPFALSNRN